MAFRTRAAAAIILCICGAAVRPSAARRQVDSSTDVPMSVNAEGFITVRATIGESGPFRFLLDTGSNASIVSAGVARRFELPPVAKTSLTTSAGSRDAIIVRLPAVTLGAVTKHDLLASVVDEAALRAIAPDLDGVLGQDFLRDERYTLDYGRRRLVWQTPACGEAAGMRLAMTRAEDRWLVDLPQPGRARPVRMVADSGASVIALFERGAPLPLPVDALPHELAVTTIAGSTPTRAVVIRRLSIGSLVLRDRPAVVVDRRDAEADGVLPLSMFGCVTFDPIEQVLIVEE